MSYTNCKRVFAGINDKLKKRKREGLKTTPLRPHVDKGDVIKTYCYPGIVLLNRYNGILKQVRAYTIKKPKLIRLQRPGTLLKFT